MANPKRNLEREAVICSLYRDGKTLQEVGDVFGLTRERVRQILRRAGVHPEQGGVRKRSERRRHRARAAREIERDAVCQANYGCYHHEVVALNGGLAVSNPEGLARAYSTQRLNAEKRGIEWSLTFPEWMNLWDESGHLSERGRSRDGYCMARISDIGPYDVQNVYITTIAQNVSDYQATLKTHGVLCADGYRRMPNNPNIALVGPAPKGKAA